MFRTTVPNPADEVHITETAGLMALPQEEFMARLTFSPPSLAASGTGGRRFLLFQDRSPMVA